MLYIWGECEKGISWFCALYVDRKNDLLLRSPYIGYKRPLSIRVESFVAVAGLCKISSQYSHIRQKMIRQNFTTLKVADIFSFSKVETDKQTL